jgi:RimJ/RimL family protein N-acetyltransferase
MYLETERLIIKDLDQAMTESVQLNSLDADNRRFLPDEVFETQEEALSRIQYLISRYQSGEGPFVYALLLKDGRQIGHVQLIKFERAWEIGFHTGQAYRGLGYATEAVKAFLPAIMEKVDVPVVYGLCDRENTGSRKVMEKCGFNLFYEGNGPCRGKEGPICKYIFTDPLQIEILVDQLASSDDQKAYRSMKELDTISQKADVVYPFFKSFLTC